MTERLANPLFTRASESTATGCTDRIIGELTGSDLGTPLRAVRGA